MRLSTTLMPPSVRICRTKNKIKNKKGIKNKNNEVEHHVDASECADLPHILESQCSGTVTM